MAWFETWFKNDLAKPINVVQLQGVMFNLDNLANKIGVELEYNGQPAALEGTIAGYVIRNDGTTLNLTTNTGKDGNKAWVILPQEAYTVEGPISIVIKLVYNSAETTIGACAGYVTRSRTSSEIAPTGTVIPSLASLEAAIAAANAAAANAADAVDYIAPTEEESTASAAHAVGSYFIYNGKLMKATSAIAQGAPIVPYASGVTNYNCAEVPNGLSGDVYSVTNTANVAANNAADAQQLVAPVESMAGMPTGAATMPHATGSYFVFGGVLHQATSDIAIGDTIVTTGTGANCEEVPGGLGGEVEALSGDVDDLKSAIKESGLIYAPDMINGSIDSSGVITTGGTKWITDDYALTKDHTRLWNNSTGTAYVDYYNYVEGIYVFQSYVSCATNTSVEIDSTKGTHFRIYCNQSTTGRNVLLGISSLDLKRAVSDSNGNIIKTEDVKNALNSGIVGLGNRILPLLSPKYFTDAGYIRGSDGVFIAASNEFTTPYIPIKAGDKFYLKTRCAAGRSQASYYTDTNGNGYVQISAGDNNYNELNYTATNDGYVRFSGSYPNLYPFVCYYNEDIPQQFTKKINDAVKPIDMLSQNNLESISGLVNMDKYNLEIGNIAITTSGWEYSSSTKRIRTPEGTTIHLHAGDVIKLSDYTNARFGLGWLNMSGNYGSAPWQQQDYTCLVEGDYVFILSYYPETVLTEDTKQALINMFSINQIGNMLNHDVLTNAYTNIRFANHKGYSSIAPEDTLPAYLLSKQLGFDMVECDISFTAADENHPNGVPVLLHDETIDRTSNGTGNIYDLTFNQVRQYDFGSWKNAKYTGTMIPSFEEFIKFCKYAGLKAQCELKTAGTVTEAKIRMCTDIVKRYGMIDAITWTSGSVWNLSIVKNELPSARLGLIVHTMGGTTIADAVGLKTDTNEVFLTISKSIATEENVSAIIAAGLPLEVFLINYISELEALDPYVSGVTTDVLNIPLLSYEYAKKLSETLVLS